MRAFPTPSTSTLDLLGVLAAVVAAVAAVALFYTAAHRARARHGAGGTWGTWVAFSVGGSLLARVLGGPAWYFLPTMLWVGLSLGLVVLVSGLWRDGAGGDLAPRAGRVLLVGTAGVVVGALTFIALIVALIACCFNLVR